MNRRAFVTGLGAVLAVPWAADAQPSGKVWRIGFFTPYNPSITAGATVFRDALRVYGYIEGQTS